MPVRIRNLEITQGCTAGNINEKDTVELGDIIIHYIGVFAVRGLQ